MRPNGKTLALAAIFLTLPLIAVAKNTPDTSSMSVSPAAQSEALQMVPATASLARSLDAKKDHPGSAIRATLQRSAHLKDGTVLPSGTALIGKVTQDNTHARGASTLALLFNQAKLKDGKTIPIEATIVGLYQPPNPLGVVEPPNNLWSNQTLQIEEISALPGVNLNSRIAGNSSGVLTSKKSNLKLGEGTGIQLAIAGSTNGAKAGA